LTLFRAALHHPDKVAAAGRKPVSEDHFVQLKLAQDTLLKPVHRFAYDRFGPDMLSWQHCSTVSDYLSTGFKAYAPTYIGSGVGMIVLSATGWLQWGRFVRGTTLPTET
jgi:DnaJ-class molecular chaperone